MKNRKENIGNSFVRQIPVHWILEENNDYKVLLSHHSTNFVIYATNLQNKLNHVSNV